MKGRTPPPLADDRRIRAALRACEHISTEALESGLVSNALNELGLLQTALSLAAEIAAQGKNPADYFDFARAVEQAAAISARLEASGFNEAMNRDWEWRTGERLDGPDVTVLQPLNTWRERA